MNTASIKAWYGQVTTGAGFMLLVPTLLAIVAHQVTLDQAIPALAAGVVGLIWPENKPLASAVQTAAGEAAAAAPGAIATVEDVISAYRLGGKHAVVTPAAVVPAPAGAAPASAAGAAVGAILLLGGALALSACAQSSQTTVAQVAVALTAADQVALQYVQLPACGSAGATAACSDPATVKQIKAAAQSAYTAVKAAEVSGASGDLAAAVAAVGALSATLPATN